MYKCDACGKKVDSHEQAYRKVEESRAKTYPSRRRANKFHRTANYEQFYRKTLPWPEHWTKDGLFVYTDDPGGAGQEASKESRVCSACKVEPVVPDDKRKTDPHPGSPKTGGHSVDNNDESDAVIPRKIKSVGPLHRSGPTD